MDTVVFTPASLISLLSQIDELSEYDIGVSETIDGRLQLTVGQSVYDIQTEDAADVLVDNSVVDKVEDENQKAYEELDDSVDVSISEGQPVESGILKEIAKSLLVGGMIRLTKKLLER